MRTYLLVSTVLFGLMAIAQLLRFILRWPVVVAGFSIPVWVSGIAFVALTALSVWSVRLLIKNQKQLAAV